MFIILSTFPRFLHFPLLRTLFLGKKMLSLVFSSRTFCGIIESRSDSPPRASARMQAKGGEVEMDTKEKSTLYVVSDIHSCHGALMRALDEAGFFADESGKLLLLGDALDRGDDPLGVIDLLLQLQDKGRLIYVKGNHEELFLNCLELMSTGGIKNSAALLSHHYKNGTVDTLLAIAGMTEEEAFAYPNELARRVMDSPYYKRLLPTAIDYYETSEFVFCHGWVPCFTVEGEYGKVFTAIEGKGVASFTVVPFDGTDILSGRAFKQGERVEMKPYDCFFVKKD